YDRYDERVALFCQPPYRIPIRRRSSLAESETASYRPPDTRLLDLGHRRPSAASGRTWRQNCHARCCRQPDRPTRESPSHLGLESRREQPYRRCVPPLPGPLLLPQLMGILAVLTMSQRL